MVTKAASLTFGIVLVYFASSTYGATEKGVFREWKFTNCSFENLSSCARIVLVYGARELVFPDNEKDMRPHCAEEKSAIKCVSTWGKKCLKGFPRQGLNLVLNGPARNIRERCAKEGTQWYLRNFKCVNDSAIGLHNCVDVIKNELFSIKRNRNLEQWLPTGCCFFDKFIKCFDDAVKPFCNAEGLKFVNWGRDSYIGDLADLACNKNELGFTGDKCKQLLGAIPADPGNEPEPPSVLASVYQLLVDVAGGETDLTKIDFDKVAKERAGTVSLPSL